MDDVDQAKELFEKGALWVALDVPQGSTIGIDCNAWAVAENFKGIKMIPPGIHYLTCGSVSGSSGDDGIAVSLFHNFKMREIFITKWDHTLEDFDLEVSDELKERISANKYELDKCLGAYPFDSMRTWVSLTDFIDGICIQRLMPSGGKIFSATQLQSKKEIFNSTTPKKTSEDVAPTSLLEAESRLPVLPEKLCTKINYCDLSKSSFRSQGSSASLTKNEMDGSHYFTCIQERGKLNSSDFLGECQFAFVAFLYGQNFDSFEHWKALITLISSCGDVMKKEPQFFLDFIKVLHFQLKKVPDDFFVDIISSNNFLVSILHGFFENCQDSQVSSKLQKRAMQMKNHLTTKYGWDFEKEADEYLPTIVTE